MKNSGGHGHRSARRLALVVAALALFWAETASASTYTHIWLNGVINPVKVRYVQRALLQAHSENAEFLLISIDTPGGLVSSMQEIAGAITNAPIPVVLYVSPTSAQASSAGAFIVLASDLAAMAPGTRIGAAHPVADGKPLDAVMDQKVTNSLVSLAKSLAKRKGRSESLAETIVRNSTSFTAEEAKNQGIIEIISTNETELLSQLDDREIEQSGGKKKLRTTGILEHALPMTWVDRFLNDLSDPTIASIFLSLGALGVAYEFSTAGVGMGGIVGTICILLGLMALSALPLQLGGLFLLIAGLIAIGLEVKLQTHGLLGIGGAISLLLGAVVLVDPSSYFGAAQSLNLLLFIPFVALITLAFLFFAGLGLKALRKPTLTGIETLKGKAGVAKCQFVTAIGGLDGMVLVDGALWQARSNTPIEQHDQVLVQEILTSPTRLLVSKIEKGTS